MYMGGGDCEVEIRCVFCLGLCGNVVLDGRHGHGVESCALCVHCVWSCGVW